MAGNKVFLLSKLSLLILVAQAQNQKFVFEPHDQTVLVNSRVILPCRVAEKQGILQWTKDDFGLGIYRNLSGYDRYNMIGSDQDGDYYLEIFPVMLEDDGKYQCQVSPGSYHEEEIRSTYAFLIVLVVPEPPKIIQGNYLETYEYMEIKLECISYGGKPPAEITWIDDYGKLLPYENYNIIKVLPDGKRSSTKSVLRLVPRKEDNNITITCQAQNSVDATPQSAKLKLQVKYPPHVAVSILAGATSNGLIPEGTNVRLGCHADANPDNVTYRWFINTKMIDGNFTSEVILRNVTRRFQNAVVKCKVYNVYGRNEKGQVLNISYCPEFRNKPQSIQADTGESVTLNCDVVGNPLPDVSWVYLYGESTRIVSVESNLTIRVDRNTAGRYMCKAHIQNCIDIEANTTIYMNGPPFIESARAQFGIEGDTVRVECVAYSIPAPRQVLWTFNGVEIKDEHYAILENLLPEGISSTLIIRESEKRHFGLYNCKVSNSYGSDLLEVNVKPQEVSQATMIFKIVMAIVLILAVAVIVVLSIWCRLWCKGKGKKPVEDYAWLKRKFTVSTGSLNIPDLQIELTSDFAPSNPDDCDGISTIESVNGYMPVKIEVTVAQPVNASQKRFSDDDVMTPDNLKSSDGYYSFPDYNLVGFPIPKRKNSSPRPPLSRYVKVHGFIRDKKGL